MEQSDGSSGINISDVLEVIKEDVSSKLEKNGTIVVEEDGQISMDMGPLNGPYIEIVEQPASKALRFRYECEGRSAGSIPGVNSTSENKTYPTVRIVGYKGPAVVIVSCVTKEPPHRAHPHNLVGRDGCKNGICCVEVNNESMTQSFDHLGIQCVKRKDIEEALTAREKLRVDPFQVGFGHKSQPGSIDLNSVRLCFQAFLKTDSKKLWPLHAVVSDIIYDKKALCDLAICKLSHCSAPVAGGLEMILLCEKVAKEDIAIWFYEEVNGNLAWEAKADFTPAQVHKQVAITFKTPAYRNMQVESPVKVNIQLRRTSDHETSDPLPFLFTPLDSGVVMSDELVRGAKRPRKEPKFDQRIMAPALSPGIPATVKREPPEGSPSHYPMYKPMQYPSSPHAPSPQDYNIAGPSCAPVPGYMQFSPNPQVSPAVFTAHSPSNVGVHLITTLTPMAPAIDRVSPFPPYTGGLEPLPNDYLQLECPMEGPVAMQPISITSKELPVPDYDCDVNLSQSMSDSLSLSCEVKKSTAQESMTDSLTNIANSTYEQMVGSESTNK